MTLFNVVFLFLGFKMSESNINPSLYVVEEDDSKLLRLFSSTSSVGE